MGVVPSAPFPLVATPDTPILPPGLALPRVHAHSGVQKAQQGGHTTPQPHSEDHRVPDVSAGSWKLEPGLSRREAWEWGGCRMPRTGEGETDTGVTEGPQDPRGEKEELSRCQEDPGDAGQ